MSISNPPIFVVDDDPSLRRAMKRLLKSAGFDVRTFSSGDEFLDSHSSNAKGCLILDIRMPGLSGFDVFDKLTNEGSPLSVIFITAYDEGGESAKAIKAGAIAFIQKPFDDKELLEALAVALERTESNKC